MSSASCEGSALRDPLEESVVSRVRESRDELVALVSELVGCDTTSRNPGDPPHDEAKLQNLLADRLRAIGAEVDLWEPEPTGKGNRFVPDDLDFKGRPQMCARLRGAGGGPSLLLNGHIDAVTPGNLERWDSDPFKAEVRDGRLYGRGAADMKGGIGAMLVALEVLHCEGVQLAGDVVFCTNTDEESSGAGGYACVAHGVKASAGITTEPTGFDLWTACRGTLMHAITVRGRSGHAEVPHPHWSEGGAVNAIEKMQLVIDAMRRLREEWRDRPDHKHPLLAPGAYVPTVINGGEWDVTYPDRCVLRTDMTYLPGHVKDGSGAAWEGEVLNWVKAACAADPWLAENPPEFERICDTVPAEVPADEPLVVTTLAVVADLGRSGTISGLNSWHDAATFTRFGTPTFSFGPGGLDSAHAPNEYVPVDDLVDAAVAIALAGMRYCGV